MAGLSIGEVAREAGIAPSAIRFYEAVGILPAPERRNGRRRYDASVLQRLAVVRHAQRAGFTLDEIQRLFFGYRAGTRPEARWTELAQPKLAELEAEAARIQAMREVLREGMRCECPSMQACTVWSSGSEGEMAT
jgi:DNA-binding transcriptional MerR regulator